MVLFICEPLGGPPSARIEVKVQDSETTPQEHQPVWREDSNQDKGSSMQQKHEPNWQEDSVSTYNK